MAKFNINKNKPDLPEDLIRRHKDFSKVMNKHQKLTNYKDATKPLYKNKGFMTFIIVLSVVLLAFIITENESGNSSVKNEANSTEKINLFPVNSDTTSLDSIQKK